MSLECVLEMWTHRSQSLQTGIYNYLPALAATFANIIYYVTDTWGKNHFSIPLVHGCWFYPLFAPVAPAMFFFFGLLKYCDSGWIYTAHKKYTPRKQPWHRAYFAAMHHGLYITTGQSITSPFRPTVVASFKQEKAGDFSTFVLL